MRSAERPDIVGEVNDAPARGVDIEDGGIHAPSLRTRRLCCPLRAAVERRNLMSGPVAPPGRRPEQRGGGSCSHALPLLRRNRRPSTRVLRTCPTRSCPHCRPWTGASACRCWSIASPAGALPPV